jgi:hypothetical protein
VEDLWGALMVIAGGLFAGGAATFAWSRVPIWRRMALPEFVRDFDQTIRWTDKVQPALLVVAAISGLAFAFTADGGGRWLALMGAVGVTVVLLASLAVLVPLQRRIIAAPASEAADLEAMRTRWFSGNLGRSVLAVASFILLAVATIAA